MKRIKCHALSRGSQWLQDEEEDSLPTTQTPGHPPTERLIRVCTWIIYVLFFLGGVLVLYAVLIRAETEIAEQSFPVSEIAPRGGSARQGTKKGAAASAEPVRPLSSVRRKSR